MDPVENRILLMAAWDWGTAHISGLKRSQPTTSRGSLAALRLASLRMSEHAFLPCHAMRGPLTFDYLFNNARRRPDARAFALATSPVNSSRLVVTVVGD